ncbi:MAG: RagB/SusD family nutrient uptake outer membrane protein, partial [Bacteroidota bacterium]
MKKVTLLILIAIIQLSFTACNSDLTEELKGDLSKSTLVGEKDAFALVDGCYATFMMDGGYGFFTYKGYMRLFEAPTDGGLIKDSGIDKFKWGENIGLDLWETAYTIVQRTNTAIQLIGDMEDGAFEDPTVKNRLIGEAKFLRAFAYSLLTSAFGDVPLITSTEPEALPARTPLAEVVAQIMLDLTDAVSVLPETHPTEIGRATKGAANTLLAKMYMREADWSKAKSAIDAVIGGPFDLYQGPYRDLWLESSRKDNEFIFSIMSQGEDYSNGSSHHIKAFSPWGYDLGWSDFGVPKEIFYAMDANDARKDVIVNDLSGAYYGYVAAHGTAVAWLGYVILQKFSGNNRDVTAPNSAWGNYGSS